MTYEQLKDNLKKEHPSWSKSVIATVAKNMKKNGALSTERDYNHASEATEPKPKPKYNTIGFWRHGSDLDSSMLIKNRIPKHCKIKIIKSKFKEHDYQPDYIGYFNECMPDCNEEDAAEYASFKLVQELKQDFDMRTEIVDLISSCLEDEYVLHIPSESTARAVARDILDYLLGKLGNRLFSKVN